MANKPKNTPPQPKFDKRMEFRSREYVKWRKIWIGVEITGVLAIIIGMAFQKTNIAVTVALTIAGIALLAVGLRIDKNHVTKLRNLYTVKPTIDPYDRSKEATAARKAELDRIDKALAEEEAAFIGKYLPEEKAGTEGK
jgi:hypothetical protein